MAWLALPPRRSVFRSLLGRATIFGVAALPLALVMLLLAVILWLGLAEDVHNGFFGPLTLRHYHLLITSPLIAKAIVNTVGFCIVTVIVAITIGLSAGWLVERTTLPGKKTIYSLMTLGLLLPTFFQAMGWLFFLHPRIGMLNQWLMQLFDLDDAPFNIASVVGMGWVEGLGLAPLAFVMTSPILRAMNPAFEDAARVHGLGRRATLMKVVLPLMWPGLIAAAIYILVIGAATFEVPAIIGLGGKILTFSTLVYISVTPEMGIPNYGEVGALSMPMIVLSILMSWCYFRVIRFGDRYAVIQGRGYRPRLMNLGHWAWLGWGLLAVYFTMAIILPLLMMAWAAFLPFFQPFSARAVSQLTLANFQQIPLTLIARGAVNSFILMISVPIAALVFGLAISWVVIRSGIRGRYFFDWIAFLPHAVPSVIFAISFLALALFLLPSNFHLYGTIFIVMVVYVVVRLSFTTRVLNGALLQLHVELENVAQVSGIPMLTALRKITLPLLAPAIVNLCLWNALLTFRELTVAAFLVTQDNITLPVVVWGIWQSGGLGPAAALSLLFLAALFPVIVLYWIFGMRVLGGAGHP
jgi:iron(III) transport system permease protein